MLSMVPLLEAAQGRHHPSMYDEARYSIRRLIYCTELLFHNSTHSYTGELTSYVKLVLSVNYRHVVPSEEMKKAFQAYFKPYMQPGDRLNCWLNCNNNRIEIRLACDGIELGDPPASLLRVKNRRALDALQVFWDQLNLIRLELPQIQQIQQI